jgi:hypothetical protein
MSGVHARCDLSLQLDVIETALAEAKRALGANAGRPDLTLTMLSIRTLSASRVDDDSNSGVEPVQM